MIFVMRKGATEEEIQGVVRFLEEHGLRAHLSRGVELTIIGAIGDEQVLEPLPLQALPGVERVMPVMKPYRLANRLTRPEGTVVRVGRDTTRTTEIGGPELVLIAGPCAVEGRELLRSIARSVERAGAGVLRGGAFKPRTSPYSFQGLGEEALRMLREVGDELRLPVVTEVRTVHQVEPVARYADMFQVGARNMQNYDLLLEVGRARKPVLLKRGFAARIEELLMAAEYVMSQGNHQVVLCERGIRSFEPATRFTLDLSAVPVLKRETHLPVIVDPSHAAGKAHLVPALALAAVAAGADGVMIEVHCQPEAALCDGEQALLPTTLGRLAADLAAIRRLVNEADYLRPPS